MLVGICGEEVYWTFRLPSSIRRAYELSNRSPVSTVWPGLHIVLLPWGETQYHSTDDITSAGNGTFAIKFPSFANKPMPTRYIQLSHSRCPANKFHLETMTFTGNRNQFPWWLDSLTIPVPHSKELQVQIQFRTTLAVARANHDRATQCFH